MRDLTPEECEFIAGGDGNNPPINPEYPPEIVVVASPPPYQPPWTPPFEPPQPPSPTPTGDDPGTGGGGGPGGGGAPTTGEEGSDAEIWLKPGANIDNLSDEMEASLDDVLSAATTLGLPHVVITAGSNGGHSPGSLHYEGNALDFRGNNITTQQGQAWATALQTALGANYDVVFEVFPNNPSNNHLHIEYDPD